MCIFILYFDNKSYESNKTNIVVSYPIVDISSVPSNPNVIHKGRVSALTICFYVSLSFNCVFINTLVIVL